MFSFRPLSLYPPEKDQLSRRLGGPQGQSESFRDDKIFFTLACTLDFPDMAETLYRLFLASVYLCVSFVVRCAYDLTLEPVYKTLIDSRLIRGY